MTFWDVVIGLLGWLFVFLLFAAALKFVRNVLYRLSGGHDGEIRDELQEIRERLEE